MNLNLPLVLQLIGTVIMVAGVIFGLQNIRQYQAGRKRESAIVMLNSFQTGEFVKGLLAILDLPEPVSRKTLDELPEDKYLAVYVVVGAWERLGVLVYRREIDLELVDDAFSGPILQSWQKLGPYIQELRTAIQRDTAMEWFQWLAERMLERETSSPPVPAYIAHRNWKPKP
jgi:hypothetical protein